MCETNVGASTLGVNPAARAQSLQAEAITLSFSLAEHDLVGKPVPTLPDHALADRHRHEGPANGRTCARRSSREGAAHSSRRRRECLGCAQKARLPEHRVRRVEACSDSRPMLARCLGGNAGLCVLLAHDFLAVVGAASAASPASSSRWSRANSLGEAGGAAGVMCSTGVL
jgi:hypothetical protein